MMNFVRFLAIILAMFVSAGASALIAAGILHFASDGVQLHSKTIIIGAAIAGSILGIFWGYRRPEDMGEFVGEGISVGLGHLIFAAFKFLFAGIIGFISSAI